MNELGDNRRAQLAADAVKLAAELLRDSRENESRVERSRSSLMARMMEDDPGKKFTIAMADQVLRMRRPARAADRMASLIDEFGLPTYFSGLDRSGLRLANMAAGWLPGMIMPLVKRKVRADSAHVIISAEQAKFANYLRERQAQGVRVNFNQLGEAVLGDREAERRLQQYLDRLHSPGIDYCSVKLSSVVSKISLTGYAQTLENVKEKLRIIYRAAIDGGGTSGPKFVNLDMEEYRDLHLTVDTFRAILDESEFENLEAGIVLQAYLPDSFAVLKSLTEWAAARFGRTGAGIKIRLVKGANLAMEQVESSLHHWPQAPYTKKADVDANYKRMLEFAARPEHANFLRVGVASHNLFDVAYAILLRENAASEAQIEFEMLEGMANAQSIEVLERTGGMILYTPVCFEHEFESAVAYLVRRLDENTAPGSFLGALFALEEGTPDWIEQRDAFLKACQRAQDPELSDQPNRTQNRASELAKTDSIDEPFENVADTDFSLPGNREWVTQIVDRWIDHQPDPVPIQFGGKELVEDRLTGIGRDPSRPGKDAYRFAQGNSDDLELAIETAVNAQPVWESLGVRGRGQVLCEAARVFAEQRGDTIGTMMLDAGKAVIEADVEISEAIDFANYYTRGLMDECWTDGSIGQAIGVVAVTPPWNFPYAIPAGGVLAALAAGNSVILKPARETVLTSWQLAKQLWQAGVPKEVLQFLPLVDGATGRKLITDPRIAAVILTGSYQTASMFQSWRPDLRLYAETSGKNSMIISVAADLDLAIKDLVKGAFGHAGQKCSATSLAIVQKEVYDSPRFMEQLRDAAESLVVSGSWNTIADVTPIVRPPDETLQRGLSQLDDGESWLLEPKILEDNPCLWRPGIRIGVRPDSWYHRNECFGPVLGVIRVDSFESAIEIQNSSSLGLTGGLHSLDPKEIDQWREQVEVGNAYINRSTTGAIVRRQPFGGWKDSCVGPGPKAGGPNYVAAFCDWQNSDLPTADGEISPAAFLLLESLKELSEDESLVARFAAAARSYDFWWSEEFSREHDPSQIHGETNHFRYRRRPWHVVRFAAEQDFEIEQAALICLACRTVGTALEFSIPAEWKQLSQLIREMDSKDTSIAIESTSDLANRLSTRNGGTFRIIGQIEPEEFAPSKIGNIPVVSPAVLLNGRLELLNYLQEQSITEIVHRYGNII